MRGMSKKMAKIVESDEMGTAISIVQMLSDVLLPGSPMGGRMAG